jgi:hypothetical protein
MPNDLTVFKPLAVGFCANRTGENAAEKVGGFDGISIQGNGRKSSILRD